VDTGRTRPHAIQGFPQGFTLIELLIVIAILSLLIAILLPCLSQAKRLAVRANCQGNLHAVGIAAGLYQATYRNYVPICWRNVDPSYSNPWKSWRVCLLPYAPGVSVFNCPGARGTEKMGLIIHTPEQLAGQDMDGTANAGSYGVVYQNSLPGFQTLAYNGKMNRGSACWSLAFSTVPGVAWRNPAASIYVADAAFTKGPITYPTQDYKDYGASAIWPPSNPDNDYFAAGPTKRFADRHAGTNYLLVDGAVGFRPTQELDTMVAGTSDCIWDTE
jgi:prepilin-type N-terminal cleavage/methylation domain-containing protein